MVTDLLCDEYAAKDERFKVVHQQNAGLSVARNTGLTHASGQYISFVDSDDWVSGYYLSTLMSRHRAERHALCLSRPP